MLKHGLFFLTENRINQYNLLLYTLDNNVKKWELLPDVIPNYSPIILNNPTNILRNVWYYKDWLVGFVVAEGSFFVQANKEISFSVLRSTLAKKVIKFYSPEGSESIHLFFKPNRAIYYSKDKDVSLVRMSSVKDIQKVVNFFSFEDNYPLVGFKKDSYEIWLKALKESSRYKDLKLP